MATKPNRNGMQPYNTENGEYMEKEESNEFDVNSYIANFKDINEAFNEAITNDNALGFSLRKTYHFIERMKERNFINGKAVIDCLINPLSIQNAKRDPNNKIVLIGKKCIIIINKNNGNIITVMESTNYNRSRGRKNEKK